jgi:hypothetical protein
MTAVVSTIVMMKIDLNQARCKSDGRVRRVLSLVKTDDVIGILFVIEFLVVNCSCFL